ncbi:DUF1672 family protein [Bacillaceae bacterium Marseille-Q3522]|nr:DUF1672 family protein [Bacillaceae bacterium Marseille-Q3522]
MDNTNIDEIIQGNGKNQSVPEEQKTEDYLVRVQDYTGEEYELRNGEETDKIAEAHRSEIEKAVKEFFLGKYKTEVIVHNVVGAIDGATVFVESVGEPHFYTFATVPIDIGEKKVLTDNVWSQQGQVEDAIITAIYAMIFDEEIKKLDQYIESLIKEYPITGITEESLEKVRAGGFSTPYYYINSLDDAFDTLLTSYLQNPKTTKEEWKQIFKKDSFDPEGLNIAIDLYMSEPNTEPDKDIFNKIVSDIETMGGIPQGAYSIFLNDNLIDKKTANGVKDNTLERSVPNRIIKP